MIYSIQIALFILLTILVLIRRDFNKVRRIQRVADSLFNGFVADFDKHFLSNGRYSSKLGYNNRILLDIASNSAEKIAAVQLSMGSLHMLLKHNDRFPKEILEGIKNDAYKTIASYHRLEYLKRLYNRRWHKILGRPYKLSPKWLSKSKSNLLIKFTSLYR